MKELLKQVVATTTMLLVWLCLTANNNHILHHCDAFSLPSPTATITAASARVYHRPFVPLQGNQRIKLQTTSLPKATSRAPSPSTTSRHLSFGLAGGRSRALLQSLFRYGGSVPFPQALGINVLLFTSAFPKVKTMLTPTGILHAVALGTGLWTTLGWRGWILCVFYLAFGQAVTKVRFEDKEKRGLAEGRGGRRGPENVWGSAATGLFCAIASVRAATSSSGTFLGVSRKLFLLAYVASLATKLSDTFASEIGKAYGKTTFLITNLKRVEPGTEGAISAEGTAAAVVGGALLSLLAFSPPLRLVDGMGQVMVSTAAAFGATNVESVLGATLQERSGFEWMTNEVINFINTAVGAGLAIIGGKVLLGIP